MRSIPNVDMKLQKLSRMFKDNADTYIKLSVLNEHICKGIITLLKEKFPCIEKINYEADWFYITCEWGNQLSTKDVLIIEELCNAHLVSFQEVDYKFQFNVDGNYRPIFKPGKNGMDYSKEYNEITSIIWSDVEL